MRRPFLLLAPRAEDAAADDGYAGFLRVTGPAESRLRRVEAEMAAPLDRVVPADKPFLGACYGIGTLGVHQGGVVDPDVR